MKNRVRASVFALVALASSAQGQCELQKITDPGGAGNRLGTGLAAAPGTLVVGAPLEGTVGPPGEGAALVYAWTDAGWSEVQRLLPLPVSPGKYLPARFGESLALDGDTLVVALPARGLVEFFERDPSSAWARTGYYRRPNPNTEEFGGGGVALKGDLALVGDWRDDTNERGAVFVLRRPVAPETEWVLETKLYAPSTSGREGNYFGSSVDFDGRFAVILAYSNAYVAERLPSGTWTEPALLSTEGGGWGEMVAVRHPWILVGTPNDGPGAVRAFLHTAPLGWVKSQTLRASDAEAGDRFGASVYMRGDRVIVGAPGAPGGKAYVFELRNWFRNTGAGNPGSLSHAFGWVEKPMSPVGVEPGDDFGRRVAFCGDDGYVTAPRDDDEGPDAGAVHVFSLSGERCRPLLALPRALSVSAGGEQRLTLDAGPEHAGERYWVVGTISGTEPGLEFQGLHLPLNDDPYFRWTWRSAADVGPLTRSRGFLDARGSASARIGLAPRGDPSLVGLELHHAFVLLDSDGSRPVFVSNPQALKLVP